MIGKTKEKVFNAISLFNPVGAELLEIFNAHGVDASLLGINHLSSKDKLTTRQIEKACKLLGMGTELSAYLENYQKDYQEKKKACGLQYKTSSKNFTKLRPIIPLLRGEFTSGRDVMDDILDYFGVDSEDEVFAESEKVATLFRKQNNVDVDPINLKGWLRRGELDFKKQPLPAYNEDGLKAWVDDREWLKHIDDVAYFKSLPQLFSQYGVCLSLVPSLPKTVYGAIRWIEDRPLIEISDRDKDLATCWFTLFHELGHAFCHRNEEVLEGVLNDSKAKKTKIEREANKFANQYLFNGDDLRKAVFDRKQRGEYMTAKGLAEEFSVSPLFTSYWLIKARYYPTFQSHISINFADEYQ